MNDSRKPARRPWPPLIIAEHVPASIKWRDAGITIVMWMAFVLIVARETQLVIMPLVERLTGAHLGSDVAWQDFVAQIKPFIWLSLAFAAALTVRSLFTLRRLRRSLALPAPAPLTGREIARRFGIGEAELSVARDVKAVRVHLDPDGRHHVVPHDPGH